MYADTTFTDRALTYGAPDPTVDAPGSGPCIGNGLLRIDVDASSDSSAISETSHATEPTLRFTGIRFDGAQETIDQRTLHMSAGLWRTESTVTKSVTDGQGVTSETNVSVAQDLTALRHFPECALQSVDAAGALDFTHVVRPPDSITITNSDVVMRNVHGERVAALIIEGKTVEGRCVAYCCYYISDDPIGSVVGLRTTRSDNDNGAQTDAAKGSRAKVEVSLRASASAPKVTLVHAIVHSSATSGAEALSHAARLFREGAPPTDSIVRARSSHALRWLSLWNGDVTVSERIGSSDQQRETIRCLNIHVRTAIYTMYASLRDPNAVVSRSCDCYRRQVVHDGRHRHMTGPALLSLCPWAIWLQPQEGPASAWTPVHAISRSVLDVWNGYRTTLDRTRLDTLYQTVRMNLTELDMRVEKLGDVSSVGTATTLRGVDVDEDAFTSGIVRRAFAAGEQMSNALRVPSDPQWEVKRDTIASPLAPGSRRVVQTPDGNDDALILLHPASLDTYAGATDLGSIATVMTDNRDLMTSVASRPIDADVPTLTFSAISALASDANRLASYEESCSRCDESFGWFMQRLNEGAHPRWGYASRSSAGAASDVVACLMYGFLGMRFQGYVTREGYHTVPAKLLYAPSVTVLPEEVYVVHHTATSAPGERTERLVQNSRASRDATQV